MFWPHHNQTNVPNGVWMDVDEAERRTLTLEMFALSRQDVRIVSLRNMEG